MVHINPIQRLAKATQYHWHPCSTLQKAKLIHASSGVPYHLGQMRLPLVNLVVVLGSYLTIVQEKDEDILRYTKGCLREERGVDLRIY